MKLMQNNIYAYHVKNVVKVFFYKKELANA